MEREALPGTPRHRRVLAATITHIAAQPWARALVLFGSLARGNWDEYSDLDLDVVIADDTHVDPVAELERLCASFAPLGERSAVIVPKRGDEGDVVLESLLGLSVRFHPLATTSPNIVSSMRLLWGHVAVGEIAAAGRASQSSVTSAPDDLLGYALRQAVEASTKLRRGRLWMAINALNECRDALFTLYGVARAAPRPLHAFEAHADGDLERRFAATQPAYDGASIRTALLAVLELIERDLEDISCGRMVLSEQQRALIVAVRSRLGVAHPTRPHS
ncbi:MAG TPA: nucleotidyltransferase domain-containing protein [Ktedonobacterales bacterium]